MDHSSNLVSSFPEMSRPTDAARPIQQLEHAARHTNRTTHITRKLNEHDTVFARSGRLYAAGVFQGPPEFSTQTASRSLQPFL